MNLPNSPSEAERAVQMTFARLNAHAWGVAFALVFGFGLLAATWILVAKGGPVVGPHLIYLSNFFPGYTVTFMGGIVGFTYGLLTGYIVGRAIGTLYNALSS